MSVNLFGRSYESAGSSSADFLIKTKGKVKIQYGSKFIDLIKDGKINADAKFIYKEKEVGVKDGIYVIGDGEESRVILLVNGTQIDLKGEIGTTYVSFLGKQETTSEQKQTALENIGFLYNNIESVDSNSIQNGIIYIEQEKKFYLIQDGQLSEFSFEIPNPYPKQFIIAKTEEGKGALLIKGSGIENSIALDSIYIYSQDENTKLDAQGKIYINILGNEKAVISNDSVVFSNNVISQTFQSSETSSPKFRLYINNGESTLEVDNLVVRNGINVTQRSTLYPEYWYYKNNIIKYAKINDSSDVESEKSYIFGLYFKNDYQVNDLLYVYYNDESEENSFNQLVLLPFKVTNVSENTITTLLNTDSLQININSEDIINSLVNQTIFLIGREIEPPAIIKRTSKGFDIIKSNSFADDSDKAKVIGRFGDLKELQLQGLEDGKEIDVSGEGIYTANAVFEKLQYTKNYNLSTKDNSTKIPSTEWVQKYINNLLPSGSIIMFNGQADSIPDGWAICNGQNGTPNLIGKFVKASTSAGETGGKSEIELTVDNLPKHSHSIPANSGSTSFDGSHSHTSIGIDVSTIEVQEGEGTTVVSGVSTTNQSTSSNGSHSHSVSVDSSNTGYVGSGTPLKWEPTYYSLIYIMKL